MKERRTSSLTKQQGKGLELVCSQAMHILFDGGSRSGKSFLFCYALVARGFKKKSRHVIFRKHFKDVVASIGRETMPKVLELVCADSATEIKLDKSNWFWTFPNGSEIWLGGLDEKDRTEKVLGKEYSTIFFNEASQLGYDAVGIAMTRLAENSGLELKAYYDCNPPLKKHWLYTLFFKHLDPATNTANDREDYARLQMNPVDNQSNLPPGYITRVLDKLTDRKKRRFKDGEWLDDVEGALWSSELVSAYRVTQDNVPEMVRIVTGVDPSGSSTAKKSATGIVTAGQGVDGHYYVLADNSRQGTPLEWGRATSAAYHDNKGDRVVGEKNYGGEMVEATLRNVDPNIPYKAVTATRGKIIRAEPVSACYEQGRVHHVGEFPDLEDEMCSYTGEPGEDSPNHLDALVWAMIELGATIRPHLMGGGIPSDEQKTDSEIEQLLSEFTDLGERAALRKELGV